MFEALQTIAIRICSAGKDFIKLGLEIKDLYNKSEHSIIKKISYYSLFQSGK